MKQIFVSLILIFSLVSCSLDDDSSNFAIETLPVKSAIVPESFDFGSSHTISITYDLPSGCHSFYNLFYEHDGTARNVAVNSIYDVDAVCTDVVIERDYTFTVNVVQREDYTFRFWKGSDENGENIFEEILVQVNE